MDGAPRVVDGGGLAAVLITIVNDISGEASDEVDGEEHGADRRSRNIGSRPGAVLKSLAGGARG